jgi:hypothetical protein
VKTSKLFLASLFAFAAVQIASAQIEIRITGSTAFRAAVHTAIGNILAPGYTVGWVGTGTLNGAPEAIFKGTTSSGAINVIIKTAWSGSVGGVFSLTTGNGIPDATATPAITAGFLIDATPTLVPPGQSNVPATFEAPVAPAALDKAGFPNVGMSDSFQASTPYKKPVLAATTAGEKVGVVPFVWVKNNGAPATLTNVTNQLASAILGQGILPLSQFTGNATDNNTAIYPTGRNSDSGTRLDAFAESGFGIATPPLQVDPTQTAGGFVGIAAGAWVNGANGITYYAPANGRSSGGTLAGDMNATGSQAVLPSVDGTVNNGSVITYLGISDSNTVNAGGNDLTYNGFAYSPASVQNGQYTFWAYEHLFLAPAFTGVPANDPHRTVANLIAAQIKNTDAVASGILLGSMTVQRASEGAPVF